MAGLWHYPTSTEPVKTRTKIWAASTVVCVLVALGLYALWRPQLSDKQIEGRPLAAWVQDLGDHGDFLKAHATLTRQGPEIIPGLLLYLPETERLSSRLQDYAAGTRMGRRLSIIPYNARMVRFGLLKITAEIALQAQYSEKWTTEFRMAVDALMRDFEGNPSDRNTAAFLLGHFGEHAKRALPELVDMCRTNYARPEVLHALAQIGPDRYAPEVIAVATNFISSIDLRMRISAMQALGACGSNAVSCVPLLLPLLKSGEGRRAEVVLSALAQIGGIPSEVRPQLEKFVADGSSVAALALLRIDSNAPTARAIVQSRLHPLVESDLHTDMVARVARIPEIARLFEPELTKLAAKTNVPTSDIARFALKKISETN